MYFNEKVNDKFSISFISIIVLEQLVFYLQQLFPYAVFTLRQSVFQFTIRRLSRIDTHKQNEKQNSFFIKFVSKNHSTFNYDLLLFSPFYCVEVKKRVKIDAKNYIAIKCSTWMLLAHRLPV